MAHSTMPDAKIRPFVAGDQDAVRRLILDGLGEHFGVIDETRNPDLDDIMAYYGALTGDFVVVERAGQIIGTGALLPEEAATGRMVRVSVACAHRRMGIGQRIVAHLLARAHQCGWRRMLVETNNDWYDAIGLYLRCGFTEYARDDESVYLERALEKGVS
jgi:ribosomal protein S18 acetylase RimI-like enzyme